MEDERRVTLEQMVEAAAHRVAELAERSAALRRQARDSPDRWDRLRSKIQAWRLRRELGRSRDHLLVVQDRLAAFDDADHI